MSVTMIAAGRWTGTEWNVVVADDFAAAADEAIAAHPAVVHSPEWYAGYDAYYTPTDRSELASDEQRNGYDAAEADEWEMREDEAGLRYDAQTAWMG